MPEDEFVQKFKRLKYQPNPTEETLLWFMRSLDKYFFSGILTVNRDYPLVSLEFRDNIFDQLDTIRNGAREIWGMTIGTEELWNASSLYMTIQVDATHPRPREGRLEKRNLTDVLETLVHEMAHAYFMLFACGCKSCEMEMGATGHGPVWQELKQFMYVTIRKWDPSLRSFYADAWDGLD